MKHRALVIDDDTEIAEAVGDQLSEWLKHAHDHAPCVEIARKHISERRYSYILLDLEIPMRSGRGVSSVQNGEKLLQEIVASPQQANVPVIIMTGHGKDSPSLAVEVMKKGAVDYVTKPFPTTGNTLEKAIREALERAGGKGVVAGAPVESGQAANNNTVSGITSEIVFYPDRVELWGVKICDGLRASQERILLDTLRTEGSKGGEALSKLICQDPSQNAVSQCVSRLRSRLCDLFSSSKRGRAILKMSF